jgi:two-component system, cell cycle response regulator DivK
MKRASSRPTESPTVLVVDDYADSLDATALGLRHAGFHVETADNGLEAIRKAERLLPDAIVMDLSMPGFDGWEAIREIKAAARTRHIPIIALTALTEHWNRTKAEAAGCDGYLQRPCPPSELAAEIRGAIEAGLIPR